jgi:hypothetical protein
MAKSQAATEYLVIIAVGMAILIPMAVYLNDMYIAYKDGSNIASAKTAADKIASLANWVYSQGKPAKVVTSIYLPDGIERVEIENKTITFKMKTKSGPVDVSEETITSLEGSLPSSKGFYNVAIIAEDDFVNITVVK